jgi:hypothetical protein
VLEEAIWPGAGTGILPASSRRQKNSGAEAKNPERTLKREIRIFKPTNLTNFLSMNDRMKFRIVCDICNFY